MSEVITHREAAVILGMSRRAVAKAMRQWFASEGRAGLRNWCIPCSSQAARRVENWRTTVEYCRDYHERMSAVKQTTKRRGGSRGLPGGRSGGRREAPGGVVDMEALRRQARELANTTPS